jgi:hypothetical protein
MHPTGLPWQQLRPTPNVLRLLQHQRLTRSVDVDMPRLRNSALTPRRELRSTHPRRAEARNSAAASAMATAQKATTVAHSTTYASQPRVFGQMVISHCMLRTSSSPASRSRVRNELCVL